MQTAAGINFRQLFESAPGLNLILQPDFTIVAVSDAYLNATMTKREQIIGKGLFEIFPDNPDDPAATGESNLRTSLLNVLQNKSAHTMAVQKYDIRRPDGSFEERYWSPINKPVLNDNNEVTLIIHRVEDVTDFVRAKKEEEITRKLTEDLLGKLQETEMEVYKRAQDIQEANNRLKIEINEREKAQEEVRINQMMFSTIFYQSPVMNSIADAETGKYIDVNENFARFSGFSREEMIGKSSPELKLMPQFQKRAEMIETIKKNGFARDVVMEAIDKNGEVRWISTSAHTVIVNGKKCFITAMIDVTQRKKAEEKIKHSEATLQQQAIELEEANKELEAFSYSVSHDLRAPLRIIHGYTEIITSDYSKDLAAEGKRMLSIVNSNVRKMGQLIDDLLNLSRFGRKELNIHSFDMNDMVNSVIEELTTGLGRPPVIKKGILDSTDSDSSLIRQVWINLISNAIKYSSTKDQSIIEINSEIKESEVIYCVRDNGVGFNMKYANKLFGVFQRLHKVNEFEGTGVGLALVHRIVSRLEGKVWVDAEVNQGAAFWFSLPYYSQKSTGNKKNDKITFA